MPDFVQRTLDALNGHPTLSKLTLCGRLAENTSVSVSNMPSLTGLFLSRLHRSCNEPRVVELEMTNLPLLAVVWCNYGLKTQLPAWIWELPSLQGLNMRGTFP